MVDKPSTSRSSVIRSQRIDLMFDIKVDGKALSQHELLTMPADFRAMIVKIVRKSLNLPMLIKV